MTVSTRRGSAIARRSAKRLRQVLPAEVRIDDLTAAAADLFIAQGIDTTTVDEIVTRAGVAKGTFYHYFATKADVIVALRERFARDFVSRIAVYIEESSPNDHHGRLSAWVRGAVETYLENFKLHDVVFHDFTHSRRQSYEKDAVLSQLTSLLEEGRQAGVWVFPQARAAALILFDGMHGVVDDAIAGGARDPRPLCRLLESMFVRMLSAR